MSRTMRNVIILGLRLRRTRRAARTPSAARYRSWGAPLCMSMTRYRLAGMTTTEACNIVAYLRSLAPITRDVADTCM